MSKCMTPLMMTKASVMEVNSLQAWTFVQCEGGDRTTELWYHPSDQGSDFNEWGNPRIRASENGNFLKWEGKTHTIKVGEKYEISSIVF